jgi:UDP-MurNAc hydroxylase
MLVTYIGHAALLIEAGGVTFLCDPWLSLHGAFDAGWYPLPANSHLATGIRSRKIDYLYVSHEHRDHFDEEFLATLPKDITLIAPGYASKPWRDQVKALGFADTRFFRTFEERELAPGVHVTVVHAPSPFIHDSALIVEEVATGHVLVNLNDCKIDDDQAHRIRGRYRDITVVFAQFSGANWFPFVYDLPLEDRVLAARHKVRNGMNRWRGYMLRLEPRFAVPFAGPAALLDPQTRHYAHAADSTFPNPLDLQRYLDAEDSELAAKYRPLLPGDALSLDRGDVVRDQAMHAAFQWENVDAYVEAYAERMALYVQEVVDRYPWPNGPMFPEFERSFRELFKAAPRCAVQVDAPVLFEISGPGGGRWLVDFRNLTVADVTGDERPREEICDYAFYFESRWLPALLDYRLRWEDFFLSFRFLAWRRSISSYNEHLMAFLRFGRPSELRVQELLFARASERYAQSTFTLCTPQGDYDVQHFCPHMGQELGPNHYDPERGVLICPRHGWTFAVPSGECLTAKARLRITLANEPE